MVLAWLRNRSQRSAARGRTERAGAVLPPTPLDSGIISGQVHDEDDKLFPEATVHVTNRLNQQIAQCTTDSYGYFVAAIPPGEHKVSISAGGYQRVSRRCEVRVNQHTTIGSLHLQPDGSLELPDPGVWKLDSDHTEIRFIAQHVGMARIHGQFHNFDGRLIMASRPEDSRIEVVIDPASIYTGTKMRDDHLRSEDFLDVENYPRMYFNSDRITPLRGNRWSVHGNLTIRGTSSPVELDTNFLGQREFNGLRAGARATTTLRREDFALNWQLTLAKGIGVVGPTVEVELDIQTLQEDS